VVIVDQQLINTMFNVTKTKIVKPEGLEVCYDSLYYKYLHIKSNFAKPTRVKISKIASSVFFDWHGDEGFIATSTICVNGVVHINNNDIEIKLR